MILCVLNVQLHEINRHSFSLRFSFMKRSR